MDILVSVIVPVYAIDYEYLKQCIESLVNQSHKKTEIILVDDGSPDNCGQICDKYAQKYDNIVAIHKINEGVSVARNKGLEIATGEYIIFVDADDWLELDCIEKVLTKIYEEEVDVLYFQRCIEKEKTIYFSDTESRRLNKDDIFSVQKMILMGDIKNCDFDPKPPWGKIIRREVCVRNKLHFPVGIKKCQDVIFNLYLTEVIDSAYYYNILGYHYRENKQSVNHRYNPSMPGVMVAVTNECDRFINSYHDDDKEYFNKLGYRTVIQMQTIEHTYTFHKDSKLKRKEVLNVSKTYLNNKTVRKYMQSVTFADFDSLSKKVRFFVERYHIYNLYYCMCKIKQLKKQKKS